MASSDSSGPTQVKLWIRFVIGLFGEGWTHPICCPRRQRLKKSRKLRNAQLPSRGGIASAISQGRESLAIFHSLPNFSGTCTQTCHSWLFLWYHPIQDGRFHCFSGNVGKNAGRTEGRKRNPNLYRKSLPHPSHPRKEINFCTTRIHGITDARSLIVSSLLIWKSLFSISAGTDI